MGRADSRKCPEKELMSSLERNGKDMAPEQLVSTAPRQERRHTQRAVEAGPQSLCPHSSSSSLFSNHLKIDPEKIVLPKGENRIFEDFF